MSDLIIFKDKELKDPFTIDDIGDTDAGDIRRLEAYLYNSTVHEIVDIFYETLDEDIHIFNVPDSMLGETWNKVEIVYSPDKLRTDGLNAFVTFKGKKRIPPE